MSRESDLKWAAEILAEAQGSGMYGRVVVSFEAGRIVHAQVERSYKPPAPGRPTSETR